MGSGGPGGGLSVRSWEAPGEVFEMGGSASQDMAGPGNLWGRCGAGGPRDSLLTFRHAGASPEVLHLFTQPFFLWPQRPDPMLWLFSRQRGHSPEQEISLPHTPRLENFGSLGAGTSAGWPSQYMGGPWVKSNKPNTDKTE